MKVIVPAKSTSTRVANKNWRPFFNGKNLVALTIEKLLAAGFDKGDIYVSSDYVSGLDSLRSTYGTHSLFRNERLCDNETPLTEWIRHTTSQIDFFDEVAWAQVCDPLFDEYKEAVDCWNNRVGHYDSLCVIYRTKQFALDSYRNPVGWQFGDYHKSSQHLQYTYLMPFTFSVLTRQSLERCPYHIGMSPLWYESDRHTIDIDTEADFDFAMSLYEVMHLTGKKQ